MKWTTADYIALVVVAAFVVMMTALLVVIWSDNSTLSLRVAGTALIVGLVATLLHQAW